jgi:hypothetical protein
MVNPITRLLIRRGGGIGDTVLVLHYEGRKSGTSYDVPCGYHWIEGELCLLTNSRWRHNFRNRHPCEVTLNGSRRSASGILIDDPDEVARTYHDKIDELGPQQAQRRLGIRINVDRVPTHEELASAIRRSGLSIVQIELDPAS